MDKIKIIFLGTNWEALEVLKAIHSDARAEVSAIITPPDRPVGRKQVLTPSPVKEFGRGHDIPVYHPEKSLKRYMDIYEQHKPDLNVCIAYGEILGEKFLMAPNYGSINIHFSLLPKYRGAIPIQQAILNGDKKTGISVMLMDAGMDTGDLLSTYEVEITPLDTNLTLRQKLVSLGCEIIVNDISRWVEGKITPKKQDSTQATYGYQKDISKEKAYISLDDVTTTELDRRVRAYLPWPVAWTILDEKRLKLYKVTPVKNHEGQLQHISEFLYTDGSALIAKTKDSYAELVEVQPEGKSVMRGSDFLQGLRSYRVPHKPDSV